VRVLVLYANPVEKSFGAALHDAGVKALRARGHEVDDCDLYAEGFDPVLGREDRLVYDHAPMNRRRVEPYVDRLLAAEALIVVFPVWNMGLPAILKGYFDRVFLPGVSFDVAEGGKVGGKLHNIHRLGAVCTYGGTRLTSALLGDAPRHFIRRNVRAVCKRGARCDFLAMYGMNSASDADRSRFLAKVSRCFGGW
jgi:putative NADPH-quinone reductase